MIPVNSSSIRAIGYDVYILAVAFHHGGVYRHSGVPESVFRALMAAPSKGAYYSHYIRGRYR